MFLPPREDVIAADRSCSDAMGLSALYEEQRPLDPSGAPGHQM